VREAATRKLTGKEATPFLLSRIAQATSGRSVMANLRLLEENARVAASIAREIAAR
jgi:pseudouridine-5'-phosphate glycosidase